VQAKIKRDEAEALELMKKHHGSNAGLGGEYDVDGMRIRLPLNYFNILITVSKIIVFTFGRKS
jgi:hypothetical protein